MYLLKSNINSLYNFLNINTNIIQIYTLKYILLFTNMNNTYLQDHPHPYRGMVYCTFKYNTE